MAANPQIFGAGIQGRSPVVSAMGRVNAYADIERDPDRSQVTFHGLAGLTKFADLGATPLRGLFSHGNYIYGAHRGNLYQIRNDGVATDLGDLDTSEGHVYFCANYGGEIMLVDGTSGYVYDTVAETFAKITDGDFPANPHTCTFYRGFGVVNYGADAQFILSGLDDFVNWDALDFSTADADPDELVAVHAHQGVLCMLGAESIEYWMYSGAADFPLTRVSGSRYGFGLAARASVVSFGDDAMALLRDSRGQIVVARLKGGAPLVVSPPELTEIISGYSVATAVATTFMVAGHPFYQISFPASRATWIYDGLTGVWSERRSYGENGIFRGLVGAWHAAGGAVGAMYWGDYDSGKIWKQSAPTSFTDSNGSRLDYSGVVWIEGQDADGNDRPVEFELRSKHISLPGNTRFTVPSFQVDMAEGEGADTGQGAIPKAMLSVSLDKGRSWGAELHAGLGKTGKYRARVIFRKLGQFRDAVFRLRVTDPVPRIVTGEALDIRPGVS